MYKVNPKKGKDRTNDNQKMFLTEAIQWKLFTNWKKRRKADKHENKNVSKYDPDDQYDPFPVYFLMLPSQCCENKFTMHP